MHLVAWWGHEAVWDRVPDSGTVVRVVGRCGEFPWLALSADDPERAGRALAKRWASRGRLGGVLALAADAKRLAIAVALDGVPTVSLDLGAPDPVALGCVRRLAGTAEQALAYAVRAAEALAGEAVGRRFYREFRSALERMAEGLPGPARAEDRRAYALLQLTRVLFLYFIQAKGWLAGRDRFLAESVDACLRRGRPLHRDLLRPLFFGTLNRPAPERGRVATSFGAIPFLNGGLFEPHPIERRLRCDVPNSDLARRVRRSVRALPLHGRRGHRGWPHRSGHAGACVRRSDGTGRAARLGHLLHARRAGASTARRRLRRACGSSSGLPRGGSRTASRRSKTAKPSHCWSR